jgi:hypothetical protein
MNCADRAIPCRSLLNSPVPSIQAARPIIPARCEAGPISPLIGCIKDLVEIFFGLDPGELRPMRSMKPSDPTDTEFQVDNKALLCVSH